MKSNPPCCLLLQNFSCISSLINLGDTTGLGFVVIIVICLFISSKHMGDQKHASQLFPSNKSVSYLHRSRPAFHKVNLGCSSPTAPSLPHPMDGGMLQVLMLSYVQPDELHKCLLRGRNNSPFLRSPGESLDFIVAS